MLTSVRLFGTTNPRRSIDEAHDITDATDAKLATGKIGKNNVILVVGD